MAVWLSLAVYLVATVGGLLYAILRGLALWRQLKRTSGTFGAEAARITETAAGIQAHLDRASASNARLGEASQRLAVSRAALDVQLGAIREARHAVRRVLWFVPGI